MELSIKESKKEPQGVILEVYVSGGFTFADNSKFREMLRHVELKKPDLVSIDLSATDFIDSAGLGMLLLLKERADALHAEVRIANANGQALKVLELSRFQDLFEFDYSDRPAA